MSNGKLYPRPTLQKIALKVGEDWTAAREAVTRACRLEEEERRHEKAMDEYYAQREMPFEETQAKETGRGRGTGRIVKKVVKCQFNTFCYSTLY